MLANVTTQIMGVKLKNEMQKLYYSKLMICDHEDEIMRILKFKTV